MMHRALAVMAAALLVGATPAPLTFTPLNFPTFAPSGMFTPSPQVPLVPCSTHLSESTCRGKREHHGHTTLTCTWISSEDRCVNGLTLFQETADDAIEAWKIAVIVISVVIVVGIVACVVACLCCCNRQKQVVIHEQQAPPAGVAQGHAYPPNHPQGAPHKTTGEHQV
eukprot:Rhum_TRINITY_DN14745_c1_g3::Rhum_TRINITY_DN14745_c1_g3_i1::g.112851::m.112851